MESLTLQQRVLVIKIFYENGSSMVNTQIISKFGDVDWSPHSPDLTTDFFFRTT
jgi:hypothetical protein